MWLLLCVLTLFTSCRRSHDEQEAQAPRLEELKAKQTIYCGLSTPAYTAAHYVGDQCDGLLWTGLRGYSCGGTTIEDFESTLEPGLWFRDPGPNHGCDLESNSISNDMILGLALYGVQAKQTDMLKRFIERTQANDWVMGVCDDKHAENCKLWATLSSAILSYTGAQLTASGDDQIAAITGYRAHLEILHILLNAQVHGGSVTGVELALLKSQAERQPHNALFQAAYHRFGDGDQTAAVNLLLDDVTHFPKDHLPNNRDNYCDVYLYQRDEDNKDWAPCPDAMFEEYSGTDLTFTAQVILNPKE